MAAEEGGTLAAEVVADRLEECWPQARYRSGVCPVCVGQAQIRLAKALARQAAAAPGVIFAATIIPTSAAVPVGQLRSSDHTNLVRLVKLAMFGLPFDWVAGGFDYSLNEQKEGRYEPHWLPHLYLLGATDDLPGLRSGVRARFEANDAVLRPTVVKEWDGRWNALFYPLKVDMYRRIGIDDTVRVNLRTGEERICRDTDHQRLRSAERLELCLYLHELGINQRLFSMQAQLHHRGRRTEIRLLNAW